MGVQVPPPTLTLGCIVPGQGHVAVVIPRVSGRSGHRLVTEAPMILLVCDLFLVADGATTLLQRSRKHTGTRSCVGRCQR